MASFKNFSIRSKFLITVLSTVLVSLIVALSAIATLSHQLNIADYKKQIQVLADVTAERSQAAMAFRDKRAATRNLESMSTMESIDIACMYTSSGKLFSAYERIDSKSCTEIYVDQAQNEIPGYYRIIQDLKVKGRKIGFLYVDASLEGLNEKLRQFLTFAIAIIFFSALVAYLLALRLQSLLTLPIIKLSKLSKLIAKTRDFTLRAPISSEDEAGTLASAFNRLLNDVHNSQMRMEDMVLELQEQTQQLESQNEFVENRNKQIKTMFAGASHDLKQPLTAMTLFVNALKEISNEEQQNYIGKLDLAIQNMKSLFEDLLDTSKLESRLDGVETGPVELKPLLDKVYHEFDAMAGDKELALRFHAKDFTVDSDPTMLERIIRNLLSNSIRYTDQGGILLACRKRKGQVCVEIWDTGRGIPKESLDSIFKSFYQVERKTAEGKEGYGLGLSIVKRLSELLKCPIEVKSEFGRGTLFRIFVPLYKQIDYKPSVQAEVPPTTVITPPTSANKVVSLPGNEMKVLLIDDDDLVRESLIALLESWRMDVCSFACIDDMKGFFGSNPDQSFDVMVSDFQLSETETGLDAIACARAHLGETLPALIVTGTTDKALLQTIKDAGIRKLKKPVKPAKLRALINHLYTSASADEE